MLYRKIPGVSSPCSVIGLDVGGLLESSMGIGSSTGVRAMIDASLHAGVTIFDLSGGNSTKRNEDLFTNATRSIRTPHIVLRAARENGDISAYPSPRPASISSAGNSAEHDRSSREEATVGESIRIVIDPPKSSWRSRSKSSEVENETMRAGPGHWGVAWSWSPSAEDEVLPAIESGATLLRVAANALELSPLDSVLAGLGERSARVVVRDPHAAGRLDGSWLELGGLQGIHPGPPERWTSLRDRLEPVTRLQPLTASRGKTLSQAAAQILLDDPRVVSVLATPPTPAHLHQLTNPEVWPLLSAEDRALVRKPAPEQAR